ncbi:pollen-specific leucine-rich repeat extensin-like protein 2 [Tanacetum coccineum]|uniref:Pollen-specific leucine-rich repeat extensin-like protein 2 n=1 Tax=Tanacetum coccineum TaxID=301880 RepID=A0ABQ5BLM3_9ASTR
MDQITYFYTSTLSPSNERPPKTIKPGQSSYISSLHSVRKSIQKPMTKQYIAPMPPTPAKVYHIDPSNFKEVVRELTSTPEFQSPSVRRLKDIAPPPLVLSTIPKPFLFPKPTQPPPAATEGGGKVSPLSALTLSPDFCKFLNDTLETNRFISKAPVMDYCNGLSPLGPAPRTYDPFGVSLVSPLGFSLSPSSLSWCSSVLLSPNTLSGFNQSPVL